MSTLIGPFSENRHATPHSPGIQFNFFEVAKGPTLEAMRSLADIALISKHRCPDRAGFVFI